MRGIILAAGAGTRLNPLTNGLPKCLVPFGSEPIIDRQFAALRSVGVDEFVVVTGFEGSKIRDHCDSRLVGIPITYIENADFATTNSIHSLYLAAGALDVECFLLNCDIVFPTAVVSRMVASEHDNVIAVDSQAAFEKGEMNVRMDNASRISEISKGLDPGGVMARSMQIVKFDASGAVKVAREVTRLVEEGNSDAFPTSAYGPLIQAGHLFAVEAGDLPWAEIDSTEDYEEALESVLPLLAHRPGE